MASTLDNKRRAQERQTKEHLAMNSKGRDEDPKPHLGYHPEAGLEQEWRTFVAALHVGGHSGQ